MRLPHILGPGLLFFRREKMRVNDVAGLDDGFFGRDFGRGDADAAIEAEVREARGDEPHVPVNSGAGIPAQRRFERIVHPHSEDVGSAVGVQKLGEIITESDEAIRLASEELAVDPDLAVHVHPVEFDDNLLPGVSGSVKLFRYQPMPCEKKPPFSSPSGGGLIGCSMLQSCGRSRVRQLASSKPGCLAAASSPR